MLKSRGIDPKQSHPNDKLITQTTTKVESLSRTHKLLHGCERKNPENSRIARHSFSTIQQALPLVIKGTKPKKAKGKKYNNVTGIVRENNNENRTQNHQLEELRAKNIYQKTKKGKKKKEKQKKKKKRKRKEN